MYEFTKPRMLIVFIEKSLPWLKAITLGCFLGGLYFALIHSPADYIQGDAMRIMYIHVPASWMALGIYVLLALMSGIVLVWRLPLAEIFAISIAPLGVLFTTISLITGSIWGKPMWGTWWVWDARLTSVLILLFLYLGYLILVYAFDRRERGIRSASLLAIFGTINLPIIKWSVNWWNTLHQPASLTKFSAPSIHPSMLVPLFLMLGAFASFFLLTAVYRMQYELNMRKLKVKMETV